MKINFKVKEGKDKIPKLIKILLILWFVLDISIVIDRSILFELVDLLPKLMKESYFAGFF